MGIGEISAYVPPAVAKFYGELTRTSLDAAELACCRRLVSDARMVAVYESLDLPEVGWRIFFDLAYNHAFLDTKGVRERGRRVYELLEELKGLGAELRRKLDALDDAVAAGGPLNDPESYKASVDPLRDTIALLALAAKDKGTYALNIAPLLEQLGSTVRTRGMPSPAELASAIEQCADGLLGVRDLPGGEMMPGDPVIRAAVEGRQHSPLAAYVRSVMTAAALYTELRAVSMISNEALAALASVALDGTFEPDAVRKIRARDDLARPAGKRLSKKPRRTTRAKKSR